MQSDKNLKSFGLIVTGAVGALIGLVVATWADSQRTTLPNRTSSRADIETSVGSTQKMVALSEADLALSPDGVVGAQVEALAACGRGEEAIGRVFAFASPENQAITGPLESFEKMVWQGPYRALMKNDGWEVGEAVIRDNLAVVLVTTVDQAGALRAFRFYLRRQADRTSSPWKTDGVFPIELPVPSAAKPSAEPTSGV